MSDDILDIANWKNNYTFLNKVWEVYDKFNDDEYVGTSKNSYYGLCHTIINNVDRNVEKHKDFCMKLMRNLGHHDAQTKYFKPSHDHCHILYNWIYNKKENSEIPNKLIIECFDDYIDIMSRVPGKHNCSYDEFNRIYLEPRKITILKIFYDNIRDIINKLNEEYSLTDSPSQNFVCECVKIYKDVYMQYCNDQYARNTEREQTCEMLNIFKSSYMNYIFNNLDKKYKIPSLDKVEHDYLTMCQRDASKSALTKEMDGKTSVLQSAAQDRDRNSDGIPHQRTDIDKNQGNSMSRTVSTAFGTVAGASSILALLYKFTPGRNWIRSGIRGGRGRINSNLYGDVPNELLFDGMEHNGFNSYSIGYEAM